MSDLTPAEYHAVACAYLRGLNSPCRTPEEGERAATRLEADARALWAVKVLDRWRRKTGCSWTTDDQGDEVTSAYWVCCTYSGGYRALGAGPNEDAARIAAAEALVAEDPTLGEGL